MNKDYYIKNFKVFDEEESYIDIRPITILTGCNNSGKSSIVKSLCLLNDFCRQADKCLSKSEIQDLSKIVLDFHKRPNDIMGSFSKVIHKTEPSDGVEDNAEAKSSKTFSLKANAYSNYFLQNMFVELTFSNHEGDHLDNGYLRKIEISTKEGEVVYSSEIGCDSMYNFNSLKQQLLYAIYLKHFLSAFRIELHDEQNYYYNYEETGEQSDNEVSFNKLIDTIIEKYGAYVCVELLRWCSSPGTRSTDLNSSLISSSFDESPELNVFLYFPFMGKYKDKTIQQLQEMFNEGLSRVECKPREIELVKNFFDRVKESGYDNIISYISNKERDYFKSLFSLDKESFLKPDSQSYYKRASVYVHGVEGASADGPNCQIVRDTNDIYPLNTLNYVLMGSKRLYLSNEFSRGAEFDYFLDIDNILTRAISDILKNILSGDLIYSRTEGVSVKRLYALEDVSDFAELLKDYFNKSWQMSKAKANVYGPLPTKEYQPGTFLNKWVKELGLAHHVEIIPVADGLGASIRMYSSENDNEGMLLADMGYGSTQLFMTILKIENAILESVKKHNLNPITYEGLWDTIIDYLNEKDTYLFNNPITVALEEPENHLHPSLQSKLADMLVDAHKSYEVQFLVETHSEYLIRKLQLLIAREAIENDRVSILYVNGKNRPSYMPLVKSISVDKDGNLEDVFGPGFFDESVRLSKELFHLNIKDNEGQN